MVVDQNGKTQSPHNSVQLMGEAACTTRFEAVQPVLQCRVLVQLELANDISITPHLMASSRQGGQ